MFGTLFGGTEHCLLDIDTCLKRLPWPLPTALLPSVNDRICKSEVVGLRLPQLQFHYDLYFCNKYDLYKFMQPVIRHSFVSFPRNAKPKGKCVISGVR